jgi:hypothetical protein
MKYAAPGAAAFGVSLETTAAMAAKLGDAGIQGSMGGTGIRRILGRLAAPNKAARDALEKLGADSEELSELGAAGKALEGLGIQVMDAKGNMRDVPSILKEIYERSRSMGNIEKGSLWKAIAGETGANALNILVEKAGAGELQDLISTLNSSAGEAAKVAGVMADNITGELDELSSAWDDVRIELFEENSAPLRQLVRDFTDVVRGIGAWTKANPELTASIAKWAAIGAAAVTVLGGLGLALGSVMMLAPAILKAGTAFMFLGKALLLNPIGLAITAIAAAAFLLWKNWDGVVGGFKLLWQDLVDGFKGAMSWFEGLPARFREFGSQMLQGLVDGIMGALGSVKDAITGAGTKAIGWFKEKLGIRSPSRVFAELGGYTMEGLEQGIAANQRGPLAAVADLGKQLTAAGALTLGMSGGALAVDTRPPLAAAGAPVAVQGDTIHITIQAAAGMDASALAQQINRILDERERGKAARIRSALYDQD